MTKVVRSFLWHMFKSFPCGLYVYAKIVKKLNKKLGDSFFNKSTRGVHLKGFSLAFLFF